MKKQPNQFLPLSQATFYILLSLRERRHGYGIMQDVESVSNGSVKMGPGTLYGALGKLEKQGIILQVLNEEDTRRKYYELTDLGKEVLQMEFERMEEVVKNSRSYIEELKGDKS